MASYVRFGIRVLYKGARSRMEGGRGEFGRVFLSTLFLHLLTFLSP